MDVGVLKSEMEALPSRERRQLIAFLLALEEKNNDAYRRELARRIDDRDPANWIPGDELDRRLGLDDRDD